MLKKSITYEDFDGNEVTEEFHFHLSKADLVELEMSKRGGLEAWLKRVSESQDGAAIMAEFKKLIGISIGKKSPDGRRFEKNLDIRNDFMQSPAYDVLFMELVTDPTKAAEFVNGIIPANLDKQLSQGKGATAPASEGTVRNIFEGNAGQEPRILTQAEVVEMDSDELKSGLATGRYKLQ